MIGELIAKKSKSLKIFLVFFVFFIALFFVLLFMLPSFETETMITPLMITVWTNIIFVVVYFAAFHPFKVSMSLLKQKGIEHIADDINLQQPTLPSSKIYCGQYALFCKKPFIIIPYSEMAWVYLYERKTYGITVEKAIIVHTKTGKRFALKSNVDEFQWLLQNFVAAQSPNIIIGYGKQQKKRYLELNPRAKSSNNKVKTITGIVLMCIGGLFSVVGIVNKTVDGFGLAILLAILGVGLILFLFGKKK